jgi:DNA processing protein
MKINSVLPADAAFPPKLLSIPDVPKKLFIRGELPDHQRLHVAIVGSRKPTAYGREVTLKLAEKLARRGAVIVSGLALGVDALAHQGALNAQGTTVAVLAGGVDNPSPFSNRRIAENILDSNGAIISEYEPGTSPRLHQFLVRNRIVSGLSDILIITEASERSGTLNTAMHALSQGRDVYVVPGNITSLSSRGCNRLLAQGAIPIVDIDEFVEMVLPSESSAPVLFATTPDEKVILDLLRAGIRDGEELHEKSGLSAALFAQTMTMLEIQGSIQPLGANRWSLK